MMETPGIPLTRWFDAVLLPKDKVGQSDNVKAMMVFGHASNSITRIPELTKGMAALELLVVADPHPTTWASLSANAGRKDNTYLLPICTQFETSGSRVASNRSLQWGEQIVPPIFESKDDSEVIYLLAKKFGFEDKMFKNIKVEGTKVPPEDVLREMNRGSFSTGYCGQSPERLKAHMRHQAEFDLVSMRAPKDTPEVGGDYYGLPWPCWGTPEVKHPGTPLLYDTTKSIQDGGGTFRARFGVERNGVSLLVRDLFQGFGDQGRLPAVHLERAQEARLGQRTHARAELATIQKIGGDVAWSTDLSGGIQRICIKHNVIPYGNGKARALAWDLPDPVPTHREPIYSPRIDLVAKYPTYPDAVKFRLPNIGHTIQKNAVDKGLAKEFPLILSSGRLVEYEGGGEETRSNKWLAELQQDMFIEINTSDAADARHQGRRLGLGDRRREQLQGQDEGAGHRTRRQGRRLDAVPLRRLVRGRGSAQQISAGRRSDRARRKREHDHHLRL